MSWQVLHSDCLDAMREMDQASVDAVVCDPPYGLEFMGKEWDRLGATAAPFDESLDEDGKVDYHGKGNAPFGGGGQRIRYGSTVKAMQEWHQAWATEALRVLKPGGHLLAFGGTRTYHRLACAVEDAGFEIRDSVIWLYGSGFPKSLDVSKAIDKAAGAEREVVGINPNARPNSGRTGGIMGEALGRVFNTETTAPATPEAQRWDGWGTALKPAHEPIVVARKPLIGTVAANVERFGTGALNVDGCRIGTGGGTTRSGESTHLSPSGAFTTGHDIEQLDAGRWPANVVLSHLPECERVGERRVRGSHPVQPGGGTTTKHYQGSNQVFGQTQSKPSFDYTDPDGLETVPAFICAPGCPVAELDRQSGERPGNSNQNLYAREGAEGRQTYGEYADRGDAGMGRGDTGGASRFFYTAKASRAERNAGLGDERSTHPTVKPIALMRWLCRLVTPPGGLILDPFAGSGTTGCAAALEGFDFIGIEREAEYVEIARARIAWWSEHRGEADEILAQARRSEAERERHELAGQMGFEL